MNIKEILDKYEQQFIKDENTRLPAGLFENGAGSSMFNGKKFSSLSLGEVSKIKAADFDKFSKADQLIAMQIAEWWFEKFYATIQKPIMVETSTEAGKEFIKQNVKNGGAAKTTVKQTAVKQTAVKADVKPEVESYLKDDFYANLTNTNLTNANNKK